MLRTSAVPPDPGAAGAPPVPEAPPFDDLMRLPPGPRREEAIRQVIAGLSASLADLHDGGRAHGGIRPDAVAHDPAGRAVLAAPAQTAPDDEDAYRLAGYAAFEQYTDDPACPCGPWTDVYGLAALAYFLATGSAPPGALARRVRDDYLPLGEWEPGVYGEAFCAAVDSGLAMPAHARPSTAAELAAAMGAFLPAAEPPAAEPDMATPSLMAGLPAGNDSAPPPAAGRLTAMRPEHPARNRRALPLAVMFVLLLAAAGYAWLRWTPPPVQTAQVQQAPQAAPEPVPPAAAPPVEPEPPPAGSAGEPAPLPAEPAPPLAANPEASADTPAAPLSLEQALQPLQQAAGPLAQEPPPKAAPVTVRVAVRPWGEVLVNGRSRGVSPPLRELSLAPGRYQVTVRNASAGDHRMTLTVAPGRPAAITHEFK